MVKISFEGRSVHLPCTEMTTGELINFFQVERPGMHLRIKRGSAYQNIWPNENGIFKIPHDVDSAILIAVKEIRNTEEELEMVQNTPTYSAFSSTPGSAVNRYNPPTGAFRTGVVWKHHSVPPAPFPIYPNLLAVDQRHRSGIF